MCKQLKTSTKVLYGFPIGVGVISILIFTLFVVTAAIGFMILGVVLLRNMELNNRIDRDIIEANSLIRDYNETWPKWSAMTFKAIANKKTEFLFNLNHTVCFSLRNL
jgi:uncharacterized membrane protein YciS (DUF1049 family)